MKPKKKNQAKPKSLIVLGMHRSGMSTVTGALGLCGARLLADEQMTCSSKEEIERRFEQRDIRSICDNLLFSAEAEWWRVSDFRLELIPNDTLTALRSKFSSLVNRLSESGTWAVSDPRLCLLFPILRPLVPDPVCLLTIRNPIEIAKSLRTSNQFSLLHGIALWEMHTRRALSASQNEKRVFVSYAELVADPNGATGELVCTLQAYGVEGLTVSEKVSNFISPDLHQERADESEMDALLDPAQRQLWENLVNQKDLLAEGQREISNRSVLLLRDLEYLHRAQLEQSENLKEQIRETEAQRMRLKEFQTREAEAQRRLENDIEIGIFGVAKQLEKELNNLQTNLNNAQRKPFKHLGRKVRSRLSYALADMEALLSSERRASFLNSAQKYDPKLSNVDSIKPLLDRIRKTTKQAALSRNVSDFYQRSRTSVPVQWVSSRPITLISVVIPVYNAAEDLEECIRRLAAFTPHGTDILFIDDASPDPRVGELLVTAATVHGMRVLRNAENMGFTQTVNRGLSETAPRDVIILNSDARVTPGWVEGIYAAAYSIPKVATVTPMSDRAGAFSAPDIGNGNSLPIGVDEITYARAFRRRGMGLYPAVPTGNGFCMFISRASLEEVGPMDAEAFPRGYGEENDFCMRARNAGFKNLIDDRTYVFHGRSKSFGESRNELITAGRAVIDQRYPQYKRMISVYREGEDILQARFQARKALEDCARPDVSNPRVLYVISTDTGGTPQTNLDLMKALSGFVSCFLFRCDSRTMQLWEVSEGHKYLLNEHDLVEAVDPVTHLSSEYDAVLANWLTSLDLDIVHIRHLAWHSISLPEIARQDGRAVVMSFHDYYTLCPTVKLIDNNRTFCGGTCTSGPGNCKADLWPRESMPNLKNAWVHVWRRRFDEALANCDAFVTTSDAARTRLVNHLPRLPSERLRVIPHGRDFLKLESLQVAPKPSEPLRILVPGNVNEAKGLSILLAILDADKDRKFEFHILGQCRAKKNEYPRLIQHGAYDREQFAAKAAAIRPHVGAIFSIWDETWCHTLTEMWSVGLPVAVLEFPTVATRVRETGAGWVLDHHDIPNLCRELDRVGRDPVELSRTQSAVKTWQAGEALAGSTRRMAADYFDVYRSAMVYRRSVYRYGGASLVTTQANPAIPQSASMPPVRVAVVGTGNKSQTNGNASTQIRLWERTRNSFDRDVTYGRMNTDELLASLRTGKVDAAIIQRTAVPKDLVVPLTTLFAKTGVPFIFDIDDNLLDVPSPKDPEGLYAAYERALRQLISAATLVTVSTARLGKELAPMAKGVELLPNRLSLRLWRGHTIERVSDGFVRALYMGTETHAEDLELISPALERVAATNSHFKLGIIGVTNGALPSWAERIEIPADVRSYERFVPWLRGQTSAFDFAVAPLETSQFNLFKSPLKLLECGALGLPILASDHSVFRDIGQDKPGVRLVSDEPEDWIKAMEAQLVAGREGGEELRNWVLGNFSMEESLKDFDQMVLRIIYGERINQRT